MILTHRKNKNREPLHNSFKMSGLSVFISGCGLKIKRRFGGKVRSVFGEFFGCVNGVRVTIVDIYI